MTEKQKRFCEEYIVDLNATEAAKRAGYSKRTAYSIGHENLKKPDIAAYIQDLRVRQQQRTQITADRVLEELALIAFADLTWFTVSDEGDLELVEGAPEGATRILSSIQRKIRHYREGERDVREVDVKVQQWNKNTALQDLGKHLGIFGPRGTQEDPQYVVYDWPKQKK